MWQSSGPGRRGRGGGAAGTWGLEEATAARTLDEANASIEANFGTNLPCLLVS
jgi:hypothetical protein